MRSAFNRAALESGVRHIDLEIVPSCIAPSDSDRAVQSFLMCMMGRCVLLHLMGGEGDVCSVIDGVLAIVVVDRASGVCAVGVTCAESVSVCCVAAASTMARSAIGGMATCVALVNGLF